MNLLDSAHAEYRLRQSGQSKPVGEWVRDDSRFGRHFVPHEEEWQACCDAIKHKDGYLFFVHLCSAKHIAHLYGVDPKALTERAMTTAIRETRMKRWKRYQE